MHEKMVQQEARKVQYYQQKYKRQDISSWKSRKQLSAKSSALGQLFEKMKPCSQVIRNYLLSNCIIYIYM